MMLMINKQISMLPWISLTSMSVSILVDTPVVRRSPRLHPYNSTRSDGRIL